MFMEDTHSLRDEILRKVPEDKLEQMLQEKEKQFHGLLTRDAALLALSKELGVAPGPKTISVSDLAKGMRGVSVIGRVKQTYSVYHFEKNGKRGRVCRILVGDDKGERTMVLWNSDVDYVENGTIKKGDLLEVHGPYIKNDEIHLGYGGRIEVKEKHKEKKISELSEGDAVNLTVQIIENYGIRRYERDGAMHEMASCTIDDGSAPARLVVWEPHAHLLGEARPGDSIRLEDSQFRNGEIHAGGYSQVKVSRPPIRPEQLTADFRGEMEGQIERLEAKPGGAMVLLEGEAGVLLPQDLSLRLLGLKSLPGDIKLETLLSIKAEGLKGKRLRVSGRSEVQGNSIVFIAESIN